MSESSAQPLSKSQSSQLTQPKRKSIIVQVRPEWQYRLLDVANALVASGAFVETVLFSTRAIFASLDNDLCTEATLANFEAIENWSVDC